jgi:putative ABC transport system permease protein
VSGTATTGGVIVIGWWQLALATGLMVLVGALSVALKLGVAKQLAIATARTYAQLLLLGLVLGWIFALDNPLAVLAIMLLMTAVAAATISRRAPDAPVGTSRIAFLAMLVVGLFVTGVIVQVEPWYLPRYVIPLAGMVLGNSMNGIALTVERTYSDLDARSDEILALTALGATPWEAAFPSIRVALRAGLIPGINTLSAAGIVFIPGMMAGQLLAGADPLAAAPYQIVVMMMVAAADVLGSVATVMLTYKRRFTADDIFIERVNRDGGTGRAV